MKIFLIKSKKWDYDYYSAHVIVAKSRSQVIKLAETISKDEKGRWDKVVITLVGEYTGTRTKPFILLSDFNAG